MSDGMRYCPECARGYGRAFVGCPEHPTAILTIERLVVLDGRVIREDDLSAFIGFCAAMNAVTKNDGVHT